MTLDFMSSEESANGIIIIVIVMMINPLRNPFLGDQRSLLEQA